MMKNKMRFLSLLALMFYVIFPLQVKGQLREVPLSRNSQLESKNVHQRSNHIGTFTVYLPIGGGTDFCAADFIDLAESDSVFYDVCEKELQGILSINGTCVSYDHLGNRSSELICLSVCDTNNMCDEYEVMLVSGPMLPLPFFDDFSTARPYPDENVWLDRDVFINNTLATGPLSLGVATFDGLDASGTPYEGGFGYSDNLTSAFFDLSGQSDIYFSFFSQPKGEGIKPRTIDSLAVDFRNAQGKWVRMWQMQGLPNDFSISDPAPEFAYTRFIIPDSFLHNQFQFRFRNRSKNEGLQELWHIDYVRLGADEVTQEAFRDLAMQFPPTSILSPYTSMPAGQFDKPEVRQTIASRVNNLDLVNLTMNDPTFTVKLESQILLQRTFIEPVQKWLLSPGVSAFDFDMNDGGSTNYQTLQNNLFDVLTPGEEYEVISELRFTRTDEILGAELNNIVTAVTRFSNYYAYDDGTAESAIIDRGSAGVKPTKLAVEFHNNVDDRLQGVQLHIPHIEGNSSSLFFNLFLWIDSLDDEPEYIQNGLRVYYADTYFDTLSGFTTYDLRDSSGQKISIPVPAGKFYIGWEQIDISGTKIPMGYDLNSPAGVDFLYFNVGQGWLNAGVSGGLRRGSLMVRPVMGNQEVIATTTKEYSLWDDFAVFPNPTSGLIH
ncbi:MAG: hypothetical protein HKN76_10320, partial [Saprospiraceae bacterium]|nr:hypothetical protein [Saprospiraceae bacterium]